MRDLLKVLRNGLRDGRDGILADDGPPANPSACERDYWRAWRVGRAWSVLRG